jgi:Putative prokaryotic signal transducing protein
MAHKNIEPERTRLERVYSGMAEGELRALAEDLTSLTSDAVEALKAEIARRKLDIALSKSGNEADPGSEQLVTIRSFRQFPEAMLAKGMLDSAGIRCVVVDDNMGRMLSSGAVGGIRMQVNRGDASAALELLTQCTPESCTCASEKQVYGVEVHICPNCGRAEFVMPPEVMQRFHRRG